MPSDTSITIADNGKVSLCTELDSAMFSRAGSPSFQAPIPSATTSSFFSSSTAQHRKRKQTATTTWEHSKKVKMEEIRRDKTGNRIWICAYCSSYETGALTTARLHLKSRHNIIVDSAVPKAEAARQKKLNEVFTLAEQKQQTRLKEREEKVLQDAINNKAFIQALLQLIIVHSLPHRAVEWPELQALLMTINYTVETVLPKSRALVPASINQPFISSKELIRKALLSTISDIHLSADVWTSPNQIAFLAIVAHFVNETGILKNALIALPSLRGSHGADTQAPHVLGVIDEYRIAHKIGYFVGDNHGSNDKLCRHIHHHFNQQYNIKWDPVHHRIRCQGHVINIAAQAFLFAPDIQAVDKAVEEANTDEDTQIEDNLVQKLRKQQGSSWRKIGAMGKLHNIVVYMRASEILYNEFQDLAGRTIPLDNDTRWNSWFTMLDVSIQLRPHINTFVERHWQALQGDFLSPQDWEVLEYTRQFLQVFWKITVRTQGDLDSIEQTLHTMNILVRHFEKSKVSWNLSITLL